MKIFLSEQIKEIDEYTIKREPITSVDLMERAAGELFKWLTGRYGRSDRFVIFAGPGNNGGDGLALARMLVSERYDCEVHYINFTEKTSPDWKVNFKRLEEESNIRINSIASQDDFPVISSGDIIIDAIFGSGLTRPVEGFAAEIIRQINNVDTTVISIDIPSGLRGEDNSNTPIENIIRADFTLSLQFPKLSFMFAENAVCVGDWIVLPIGLSKSAIINTPSNYFLLDIRDVSPIIITRNKFDHKGNFGHGLFIAGSSGKMGAAILGARAALRSGLGLITCHIPYSANHILQSSVPEAMVRLDRSEEYVSEIGNTDSFSAVGIGPGIGTNNETQTALKLLLSECGKPMVIDADALNILALNKDWLKYLHSGTILTPHPKEFERLAGKSENSYARLIRQSEFSKTHNCIVVLKGAHTSITSPDGKVIFNSTGNPGMATGGSGDVLTGIILSLLTQGYDSENAAVLGVFLHGMAGDLAVKESCFESVIASDIINNLGKAFNKIWIEEL